MKLKLSLLVAAGLIVAAAGVTSYLQLPSASLPPNIMTLTGINDSDPTSPQYQIQIFRDEDERPVVAYFLRLPPSAKLPNNTIAYHIVKDEFVSRLPQQGSWHGDVALLAGETVGEKQNIVIRLEDFNDLFAPHLGPLEKRLPYYMFDQVWNQRIAPQRDSPPLDGSPENGPNRTQL